MRYSNFHNGNICQILSAYVLLFAIRIPKFVYLLHTLLTYKPGAQFLNANISENPFHLSKNEEGYAWPVNETDRDYY